jgi:hypothetical protein
VVAVVALLLVALLVAVDRAEAVTVMVGVLVAPAVQTLAVAVAADHSQAAHTMEGVMAALALLLFHLPVRPLLQQDHPP